MNASEPIDSFLPEGVELFNLLEKLRELCWGSADILMAYARGEKPPFGFPQVLSVKEGIEGPVSAADLAVNSWLINGLQSQYPLINWFLLSEETAKDFSFGKNFSSDGWIWILDPLDGTKDFLRGSGEYAVHLALLYKQQPVLGIVLIPELEELWFGGRGLGTWCENRIREKKFCSFSNRTDLNEIILVASRSHRDERLEQLFRRLEIPNQKAVGSIGCKVATILRGESDLYISLSGKTAPKHWDLAAPEIVLKSAGGNFTHVDGTLLKYDDKDFSQRGCLLASNGINHKFLAEKILDEINQIDPSFQV